MVTRIESILKREDHKHSAIQAYFIEEIMLMVGNTCHGSLTIFGCFYKIKALWPGPALKDKYEVGIIIDYSRDNTVVNGV